MQATFILVSALRREIVVRKASESALRFMMIETYVFGCLCQSWVGFLVFWVILDLFGG